MTPQKSTSDADIEAAIRAELPWLVQRAKARDAAASEDTVSGRLRRAVTAMRQPYEQVSQATGIPFQELAARSALHLHGFPGSCTPRPNNAVASRSPERDTASTGRKSTKT